MTSAVRTEIKDILRSVQTEQNSLAYILPILTHITYYMNRMLKNAIAHSSSSLVPYFSYKRRRQVQVYHSGGCLFSENVCTYLIYGTGL